MTDRDSQLQKIIEENPGIQFREIMRSSGLKNGVLSHYLGKLEKTGIIKVIRGPRQARFFSPKITEDESIVIKALRKQTPRDLLLALIENDGLEFSQLVSKVKKSPSTVSLYLSQIVDDGLVEIRLVELKKRYHIKARDLIDKLIEDYRPSLLEKPTSGFEDIINSF
ncbi:MAG: winged helix-turn-helix transcriptional regulator [Candidatus Nitrosopumilus sp. bin_7KS]